MNGFVSCLRGYVVTVAAFSVVAVASGSARADDSNDSWSRPAGVAKLSEEGAASFKARDYRHAVEKFLEAYALDPDPNLLFNVARCYESMGDTDAALEKYEAFLAKPDADAKGKQRASEAIRSLRQAKSAATDAKTAAAASPPPAAPGPQVARTAGASVDRPAETSRPLTSPTIVLGSGVLAAAVGGVAYALGARDHGKVTASAGYGMPGAVDPLTEAQARALVQSGDTKKLIGVIGFGVGGALIATSAILFATTRAPGDDGGEKPGAVAFGLSRSGNAAQLLLQGRF